MEKSCCFFGHRDTPENIKPKLTEAITKLSDEIGISHFYVCKQGDFESLVISILKELAVSNPKIRYSIVLAYLPAEHSAVCDENTLYPEGMESVPKRFCIARRNDWMIDHSKYVDIEKIRQSFVNKKFFIQNKENLQYYFQTLHIII